MTHKVWYFSESQASWVDTRCYKTLKNYVSTVQTVFSFFYIHSLTLKDWRTYKAACMYGAALYVPFSIFVWTLELIHELQAGQKLTARSLHANSSESSPCRLVLKRKDLIFCLQDFGLMDFYCNKQLISVTPASCNIGAWPSVPMPVFKHYFSLALTLPKIILICHR